MSSADESVQAQFRSALADDLRIVCTDPFSSHVVQRLLLLAAFLPTHFLCNSLLLHLLQASVKEPKIKVWTLAVCLWIRGVARSGCAAATQTFRRSPQLICG